MSAEKKYYYAVDDGGNDNDLIIQSSAIYSAKSCLDVFFINIVSCGSLGCENSVGHSAVE